MAERACTNCGEAVPEGRSVCPACGTLQRAEPAATSMAAPTPVASTQGPLQTAAAAGTYRSPIAMPPPHGDLGPARRPGTGKRGPMGCLIVSVVVVIVGIVAGYLIWRANQPDPAPLNTADRSSASGYGYSFTMDGKIRLVESHTPVIGLPDNDASIWMTTHDRWEELVLIVEVTQPGIDSITVYQSSARDLAGRLLGRFNPDVTDTSPVLGRRATEFSGDVTNPDGKVKVGDHEVKRARISVLVTTLDSHHLIAIALASDPQHPGPTKEIATIRQSVAKD